MSPSSITAEQLKLYRSLFKGREDVFALRWEKNGKGSYMPAFSFDPHWYKLHLAKGGTFQTFHDKTYKPLTDQELLKQLNGEQVVGLYPLLQNNTSWFIAADFDELNWEEECRAFLRICEEHSLPAYLERSRSGKGGHVWIFFDEPYEAFRSRKIILTLLEKSGITSIFDKNSSFDRLFPNQDTLSKKGIGNLIALPLNKSSLDNGNSCFVDPVTLQACNDQWRFLESIKKAEISYLNELYRDLAGQASISDGLFQQLENTSGKVNIFLNNEVRIARTHLPASLVSFLKEELNFPNTEFQVKKNINKSTFGIKRYFKLLNETSEHILIPRGFIGKLLRFCIEKQIDYTLNDQRIQKESILFKGAIELREYQKAAKDAANKKDFGVIVAPAGAGKTIVSLAIIQTKQQPTLILVHRKTLADQWIERIESFLGISKKDIGKIGAGRNKLGKQITVAMIQSMEKALESENGADLCNAFGTIIIDECHHVPAETYQNVISKLNSFYLYGLTATPFRKYNDGKLIFIHLGEIIHEIKSPQITHHQGAKSETVSGKINERIEVPIETFEFKFGAIGFKYRFEVFNHEEIEFEIEKLNVRPEFAVLKPYFIKFHKKESVNIHVQATLQHGRLIFKSAASKDLDKINREVIDSVKFRFLNKGIIKGVPSGKTNLLDAQQLQGGETHPLYDSEEDLLENILSLKHYKHHQHLRYLSKIHESAILKLRFVLEPGQTH